TPHICSSLLVLSCWLLSAAAGVHDGYPFSSKFYSLLVLCWFSAGAGVPLLVLLFFVPLLLLLNYHFICRLCLKLKNLEHRALILNSKRSWTKCSWG
ncbi:hypothetical protein Gotur_035751, partial [Gossypium turneri]